MGLTLTDLDTLERQFYTEDEWAELQKLRAADPGGIHYVRRACIYADLGAPEQDPIGRACPDCRALLR